MINTLILIAIKIEERDLIRFHGKDYENYRDRVSMLVPFKKKGTQQEQSTETEKSSE